MLKVVIYDSGYGGEDFADKLEEELQTIEVIRIIDWRHAEAIQENAKEARKYAEKALFPYIGKVDLIIFANHLLTITSLKYFIQKYKNQKFTGLELEHPCAFVEREMLALTTKAVSKTIRYHSFIRQLKMNTKTLVLDSWPIRIDDGDLTLTEIKEKMQREVLNYDFHPKGIIIACSQFNDIVPELKNVFGKSVKIYNGYRDVFSNVYKLLHLKGYASKKR